MMYEEKTKQKVKRTEVRERDKKMNSNFEYYRIFYYVAKYGNLTKAASALQTSQPAVTRTIHKLEAELGCRLFIRSKSGMELTPEGKTFYEYVSAGCAQFFRGEQKITNLMSVDEGSITISATETALHCCLFQAIEAFRKIHPKVRFKILNNSSQKSIEVLKKGQVDMAMISSIPFAIEDPLIKHTVHSYTDILIAGRKYRNLKGRMMTLGELCHYPWVSLTSDTITRIFLDSYFAKRGLPFEPAVEFATTDLLLPAIEHNLGIGFLPPEFVKEAMMSGNVFQIEILDEMPDRSVSLVYDSEYPQSIASTAFRKFVLGRCTPGENRTQ